ncbi:hypothetical protein ACFQL3_04570 [Natronoarchaeum sp. GCM10025321]|uniref:hypothetical protein n=1 Tax=Natronoarchaeum sp. GCM10025321 TaxID=3252684 RepID=UPI00360BFA36
MALSERVPLMKPGHRVRNVAVGFGYFIVVMSLLSALGGDDIDDDEPAPEAEPEMSSDDADTEDEPADLETEEESTDDADSEAEDETDPPDEEPVEDAEDTTEVTEEEPAEETTDLTEEDLLMMFELVVEGEGGLELADVERDGEVLHVEYYPQGTTEAEISEEIGYLTGAYIGATAEGLDTERMEVTALHPVDESAVSHFYVEREWVDAHLDDELTVEELTMEVLMTLEVEDETASVGAPAYERSVSSAG